MLSKLLRGLVGHNSLRGPATIPRVLLREFSPATYTWLDPKSAETVNFVVTPSTIKTSSDRNAEAELNIDERGIRVKARLHGSREAIWIYLGNYFFMPESLKRRGLATATLVAIADTFHLAAFSQPRNLGATYLEGFFVGEGAHFARSMTGGQLPRKGAAGDTAESADSSAPAATPGCATSIGEGLVVQRRYARAYFLTSPTHGTPSALDSGVTFIPIALINPRNSSVAVASAAAARPAS